MSSPLGHLKRLAGPTARAAFKTTAAGVDLLRRPAPGITILIYHRVGAGAGGQMDLSPADFDLQLSWLRSTQRVLSLDDAAAELAAAEPGTDIEPGVVLTFDDGTADWAEHVLPALGDHETPATFYVATRFVDEQLPFPGDGRPISWSALAEMADSPFVTLGSHTHSHALLDRVDARTAEAELDRSIELLAEHTGVRPEHFAYPKALPGNTVADLLVRKRFRTAVIAESRANLAGADLHALYRTPIQASDAQAWFRRKAVGGMAAEDSMRRAINKVRYRRAEQ